MGNDKFMYNILECRRHRTNIYAGYFIVARGPESPELYIIPVS